ncbi:MAG: T9SS type A sorting domain-containing protein, partial [Ignavibacteria bacterium]|nr:T9SS type A sorting domain-containing protein [Ignavibacteria bacterium]
LYHSSDSGTIWTQVFNSDTVFFLSKFLAVNDNGSIFFSGLTFFVEEVIFYSNDFGVSWDSVNFSIRLTAMYSDGKNIYAAFDDFSIKYSVDNGETWQVLPTISFGSPVTAMKKLNNGVFLAATNANGVFYSSDNGNNWNSLSAGLPSGSTDFPNFIAADINNMLYIGYYSKGVYKNDTWYSIVPVELTSFTAFVNGNNVILEWVTSTEINNSGFEIERASSSTTPVQAWEKIGFVNGNGTTTNQSDYSFIDSEVKTGKFFYRLNQIDFDGSFKYSDIVEIEVGIPEKFALYQNYPNPFNPTTKIEFAVGSQQLVIIKVYDMLGNEIATLVNDVKEPGIYEIEFSAKGVSAYGGDVYNLSSGTYFYQLKAGNYIETKKLLLIK